MDYHENILSIIGNTPLVKLGRISANLKPLVLAKLELLNPGGSVKDRIGLAMILDAEIRGLVKRGGTIVEPTSGNTGVGLVIAGILLGYELIVTMPDKMSMEKRNLLQAYGAKVIVCPTQVSIDHPDHYINVARRISRETPNSFMPNQYTNQENPRIHFQKTGPEIWHQTEGKITHFVAGMGTGGTISGVSKYLKEQNSNIKVIGVDPEGSILRDLYYRNKVVKVQQFKIEGIGEDFLPEATDLKLVDDVIKVSDKEAYHMSRRLAREEAILCGSSSGAAVCGALVIAEDLTEKEVIVTLLPDRGDRYLTKLFNDDWMSEQGFL